LFSYFSLPSFFSLSSISQLCLLALKTLNTYRFMSKCNFTSLYLFILIY
jgi:hypothetical protein